LYSCHLYSCPFIHHYVFLWMYNRLYFGLWTRFFPNIGKINMRMYVHVLIYLDRALSNMHALGTSSWNSIAYLHEALPWYKLIPLEKGSKFAYPTADAITKSQRGLAAVSNRCIMSHTGNHTMYNACLLNVINSLSEMASCVERCVVHFRIIRFGQNWINFLSNSFCTFLHISVSSYFIAYAICN